jgi:hypothetical protein
MPTVSLAERGWFVLAHRALEGEEVLDARAGGWRARLLRSQLPKIAATAVAFSEGKTLGAQENFSLIYSVVLLRFHEILFYALAHGYTVSWVDHSVEIVVTFRKHKDM